MNKPAAIYARVSSDRQKENQTIASQTAALTEYAESHGYLVPAGWVVEDDGHSGARLIRPRLGAERHTVIGISKRAITPMLITKFTKRRPRSFERCSMPTHDKDWASVRSQDY